MKLSTDFEIVEIAGDYLAVPVGEKTTVFHGVIALSEPAVFMLRNMKNNMTIQNIAKLINNEYEVGLNDAEEDVKKALTAMIGMGLVEE